MFLFYRWVFNFHQSSKVILHKDVQVNSFKFMCYSFKPHIVFKLRERNCVKSFGLYQNGRDFRGTSKYAYYIFVIF